MTTVDINGQKISARTAATSLTTSDTIGVIQSGSSKKATLSLLPVSTPQSTAIAAAVANPWNGVAYSVLGTSITQQSASFVARLDTLLGSTAQNLGVSGQTLLPFSTGGIYTAIDSVSLNSKLVIIDGLINDLRTSVDIGSLTDTTQSTLHGGLYQLVKRLLAQDPKRQIVFCTPYAVQYTGGGINWEDANLDGATFSDWCNAIKAAGQRLGIPVCDIARDSGINGLTTSVYTSDGLHIDTELGSTAYATCIYNFLRTIPRGPDPTAVTAGWTLRDAVFADFSGIRATPTAYTSNTLTYTVTSGFCAILVGGTGINAMEFNCASNPSSAHIVVAKGADGFSSFGAYLQSTIAFRTLAADGNITNNSLVSSVTSPGFSATRFRVAVINGSVRFEYWNGSAWILDTKFAINLQSSLTAGYKETPQLGLVVQASNIVFTGIKVGTYTPV